MAYTDRLEDVADELGYRDTGGYVHETSRSEAGAGRFFRIGAISRRSVRSTPPTSALGCPACRFR